MYIYIYVLISGNVSTLNYNTVLVCVEPHKWPSLKEEQYIGPRKIE